MALHTPRPSYTAVATPFGIGEWDVTIAELDDSWTVAFSPDEIEDQARRRIALDTGRDPTTFDVNVRRMPRAGIIR
jgi:hypothetical protein